MAEASRVLIRSRSIDPAYLQFYGDDFLRLLMLRFIFCHVVLKLHRMFKSETSRCCPVPFQPPVPVTPYAATKPTASTSSSHPENYKYSQPCTARPQWSVERSGRHHGLIQPLFAFRTVVRSHQHELAGLRGTTCTWHAIRHVPSPARNEPLLPGATSTSRSGNPLRCHQANRIDIVKPPRKLQIQSALHRAPQWAVEWSGRHHGLIQPLFAFRTVVRSHQHELAELRGTTCAWHATRHVPSPARNEPLLPGATSTSRSGNPLRCHQANRIDIVKPPRKLQIQPALHRAPQLSIRWGDPENLYQRMPQAAMGTPPYQSLPGSNYLPRSHPPIPESEVLDHPALQRTILELAEVLDVRSLFSEIDEAD
ncbi:hypothetical protein MRX96_021489 [Rhipicephalus microplus]